MKKAVFILAGLLPLPASPATLSVIVSDASGAPLEDAVAWATPRGAPIPRTVRGIAIEQIDKTFVPLVSVVQAGAQVSFPNRDETRHHVYSFSPAKVFEIKLYAGAAVAPSIVFDKPGDVVLGCNIHDNMIGYVYVVDTPYYGKSGPGGRVRLEGLPEGEYDVRTWHYAQSEAGAPRTVKLRADENASAAIAMTLKPRIARPPPK